MSTPTPVEELIVKLGEAGQLTQEINNLKAAIEGHKREKQRFTLLIQDKQAELNTLMTASEQYLRDLKRAINVVLPG